MRLTTALLVASVATASSGAQTKAVPNDLPTFWVLVHAGDAKARQDVFASKTYPEVKKVAISLGYVPVVEGKIAYFFPAPAWSGNLAETLSALLQDATANGFGRSMKINDLPKAQRDSLRGWLKNTQVGGTLGEYIRTTKDGSIQLNPCVDVNMQIGGRTVKIRIWERPDSKTFSSGPSGIGGAAQSLPTYPDRPELFGLMVKGFAVDMVRPISEAAFAKTVDHVKDLLKARSRAKFDEMSKALENAFSERLMGQGAMRLNRGESLGFDELPTGLKDAILDQVVGNAAAFGFKNDSEARSDLSAGKFSIPRGGKRIYMDFTLDRGSNPVGWSVADMVGRP